MFKKIAIVALVLLVVAGVVLSPKISLYLASVTKTNAVSNPDFYFRNERGLVGLAEQLEEEGFVSSADKVIKVGSYKGLDSSRLAAGYYRVERGVSIKDLLNGFTVNSLGNGNAEQEVDVSFNFSRDVEHLGGKVAKYLMFDSLDFHRVATNPQVLASYGFTKEQFPALFLPNTYSFYWDTKPEQFIKRMSEEFKQFWTAERIGKLKNIGLSTPSQASTLASIVYSEQSRVSDEWPIIAGLYLNRIRTGVALQSDPTFKFCWGRELDTVQRLLYIHRDIDCPYNTYKYKGLPPGPICVVPAKVIDAVLNAEKNSYIFMIAQANNSMRHHFTKDYAEHQRNAKIYQKWLKNRI